MSDDDGGKYSISIGEKFAMSTKVNLPLVLAAPFELGRWVSLTLIAIVVAASAIGLTSSVSHPAAAFEREIRARTTKRDYPSHDQQSSSIFAQAEPNGGVRLVVKPISETLTHLPAGMPPRVLIRYLRTSAAARQRAETLAKTLKEHGFEVADMRGNDVSFQTELRFSYAPDQTVTQQVGRLAGVTPTRAAQPKDGLMAPPGTIELSISGQ